MSIKNKFHLEGRLTKDVEVNDRGVAKTSIAVDHYKGEGKEKETDFFNLTAFAKTANHLAKWYKKGSAIQVEGELHNNNWTDKDGKKHYDIVFYVNDSSFGASGKNESNTGATSEKTNGTSRDDDSPAALDNDEKDPMLDITSDDLPF